MLESLLTLTSEEKDREIRTAFSRVFATESGMLVLVTILNNLWYFLPTTNEGEQACNNAAKEIIGKCSLEIASRVYGAWKNVMSEKQEKKEE